MRDWSVERHLEELRNRILVIVAAFVISLPLSAIILPVLVKLLLGSAGVRAVEVGVGGFLSFYFTSVFVLSVALVTPVVLYEAACFVLPALARREKKSLAFWLFPSLALFLIGCAAGFFLVKPTLAFAALLADQLGITLLVSAGDFISLSLALILGCGLAFEFPVVIRLVLVLGIIGKDKLRKLRPAIYTVSYVLAAWITPDGNVLLDVLLTAVLVALFEASLLLPL